MKLRTSARPCISPAITSVLGVACLFLAAPPARAQELTKPDSVPSQWHAKYVGGSESVGKAKKPKVDLSFSGTALDMVDHRWTSLSIPLDQITRVDSQNLRPANVAVAGLKTAGHVEGCFARGFYMDSGATAILYGIFGFVPTMGISAMVHTKDKYVVNVGWDEPSEHREARLELGAGEYSSFLSQLQRATSKQWFNLREEEQTLQKNTTLHASFTFTQPALVAGQTLKKGRYQIVSVDRKGAPPSLVFIAGNSVNPHKVRAVVAAEIVQQTDNASVTPVVSEQDGKNTRITQVNVAGKCFRVKTESVPPPQPSEQVQSSSKTI